MTFEFFDDETNYVSKRQVSQEVRARITAKLGKISSMISQVSQKLVPDFRKQSFLGAAIFVEDKNIKIVFEIGKYVFNYASISLGKIEQKYY